MPLVSHAPRPQMNSSSSREGNVGRHRIHVRRERHDGIAEAREDVAAVRLDFHFFDPAVVRGAEARQKS